MRRRRLSAVLLTSALVIGGLQAPAAAAPSTTTGTPTAQKPISVTLLTGDRVTTHGKGATVQPGPGRSKVRFLTQTIKGHRYVIPTDALALLRAGRLDKRLFDISELAAQGGGDLRLLISYPKNSATGARSALSAGGARVTRDIAQVGTLAARANLEERATLWSSLTSGSATARSLKPGVQRVWLDGKRKVSLDHSVPQIGAPTAWQAGYDGTGVTVAILDTGIDATHPDLAGKIVAAENFTTTATADDEVGHGTHVASIIAGSGAASGGRYKGVAPGAKLLIGKVCETEFCDDSAILAGMAWAAERAPVINMSLGGGDTPEIDPLEQAVNDLTAQYNTLFVIASGNAGPNSAGSPSTADSALAVGAVDRDDQLAYFSSTGPRVGDHAIKPDITAPGVDIVAAKAKNGFIGDPAPVDGYVALSGTSMATPHVAGAAAILTQEHPAWSSKLRKNTLMGSAKTIDGFNAFEQGAGRVDVAREITQTVSADEGSLSFGLAIWPHGDDQPVTKTITYRNSGTAAVTLALSAPAAPFTVAASTLTVPAGGTASTTVTADTSSPSLSDGLLSGYLVATAGDLKVTTPLGVDREVESYDVVVNTTNPDGTPSLDHYAGLFNLDTFQSFDVYQAQGSETVRLPKGRYGAFVWINNAEAESTAMLTITEFVVDKASTISFDGRLAKPVNVKAPQANAGTVLAAVNADWTGADWGIGASALGLTFDQLSAAPATPVSKDFFVASVNGSFADPGADGTFRNSPWTTDLAYFQPGKMFNGLTKTPRLRDLATVKADYAVSATGAEGTKGNFAKYSENSGGWFVALPFSLPFHRTEYLSTEAPWQPDFMQQLPAVGEDWPELISEQIGGATPVRAGRTYHQAWNTAVFGPNVTQPLWIGDWVSRQGDHLSAYPSLFGDGAGHPGFSTTDTYTSALYQGSTKIGEGGEYDLPAATAKYRLEVSATRSAPHLFSTSVSGTWTFKSGHAPAEGYQRLALSTVRFSPNLDDHNATAAGRRFEIPVTVEQQPGSTAGTAKSVKVEVSYDDGKTWHRADVRGSGNHRVATVNHPRKAGFASLRVASTDTKGNTVSQTVIRAYALR
ncbi:subtilisin family serine protease [Actinoplanes tereljensis]|uniref:Serine protease n=1 Tax=Paractinoplanes tereljensis TaxID=571912 RepID=A0A919NXI2_9ACTN|nr:S8 family serine peptidase [Actinoplanes tereljensis]GIF25502.1 serine protease [Actinoplanes tereljensis]